MAYFGQFLDPARELSAQKVSDDTVMLADSGKSMYSQSPWYRHFLPKLQTAMAAGKIEKGPKNNKFYNPDFANLLLKKHFAYMMFFMKFFSSHGHTELNWQRPNNGEVERYHRYAKEDAREHCGPLNTIPIGKYVARVHERLTKVDYKMVTLKITGRQNHKKVQAPYSKFKNAKTKPSMLFNGPMLSEYVNKMAGVEPLTLDLAELYNMEQQGVSALDALNGMIDEQNPLPPPSKRRRVIYDSDSDFEV
jgi:hypothetical protein